jgi:membrane-associated protease RseP (regulator of RpoE activity)
MLPGLPPRDKSFKGWLFPLVVPVAAFIIVGSVAMSAACVFGDHAVTIDGTRHTGFDAVLRIVLAAPLFFVCFLLLTTTICWLDSRMRGRRRRE